MIRAVHFSPLTVTCLLLMFIKLHGPPPKSWNRRSYALVAKAPIGNGHTNARGQRQD